MGVVRNRPRALEFRIMAESLGSPPPSPPTEVPPSDVASQMRCPICLDNVEDKAFTDPCFHILNSKHIAGLQYLSCCHRK